MQIKIQFKKNFTYVRAERLSAFTTILFIFNNSVAILLSRSKLSIKLKTVFIANWMDANEKIRS